VLTLRFDRFTPLTPAPLYALRKARQARAIVVTTPTAGAYTRSLFRST